MYAATISSKRKAISARKSMYAAMGTEQRE